LGGAVGWLAKPQPKAQPAPTPAVAATTTPVRVSGLTASGYVVARSRATVAAEVTGRVVEVRVEEGQVVRKGDVLAMLDDRDLRLERQKLISQSAQQVSERRQAVAEGNRAKALILDAQAGQVRAQMALVEEQVGRTRLIAPFDGVVVKGDLSQSLGAAVERGNALFELAPLDSYRVIMKVDERDIGAVQVGQTGRLALTSMPNEAISVVIQKITPVSVVDQGRNFFRVEASATGDIAKLRPGMEGVGKIDIDQRKLLWIWTHKLTHWLRMWVWSWWP
jgi:RND family efflux transporter MFP subunit